MRLSWLLLALGLLVQGIIPAAAQVKAPQASRVQNPDKTFTPGADYDTIIDRGWIRFGVYDDFAPYSWREGRTFHGVDVELGKIIAEELGVKARFTAMGADETLDDDLRNYVWKGPLIGGDVVNVMLRVPYDRELDYRNELVVLTGKYMVEEIAIAYRRDVYPEDPPVPAYFRFDEVGVENDSISDFYLSRVAGGQLMPKIRRYKDTAAAMAGMKAGEVKAVMGPRAQLEYGVDDAVAVHQPPLPGLSRGKWTLGIALRHNYRQLGYAVDDAIGAALADGRLEAVFQKFGLSLTVPER